MVNFLNSKRKAPFFNFKKNEQVKVAEQEENAINPVKRSESFSREVNTTLLSNEPALNKTASIKKITSSLKKSFNNYVDPINKELEIELLPSPNLNFEVKRPGINSTYIYDTDEEQLEVNIIEHKIQQKLNMFLNIYNPTDFEINLSEIDLNSKKKFYSNLTYIETLFHYDNDRSCIVSSDLNKIKNVDSLVYQLNYNIFTSIDDINPSSTKQVIRGLRFHLKHLIKEYHQQDLKYKNVDTYEGLFTFWDEFNTIFTFEKMLEIENTLKVLFPRKGCSLSEVYLQYKLYSIYNSKNLLVNIQNCFLSLIYLFLLNDGLIFWDEYLKILTIDEDLYKSLSHVLVYDNLALVFEFLEMLIFLIGQFSYKPFLDIIQYLKNFSLIFFSLENCLNLKNDHKFKDLKEFKKVTDKLSTATLIILEKYLVNLSKNNQLNDFLILEKLTDYLGDIGKYNNSSYSKKILTLSQPIVRNSDIPDTKYRLVSSILTNLKSNKKFINGENYFVTDILLHFLKFLPNHFKQFYEKMVVNDKYIIEYVSEKDSLEDDINIYIQLLNENSLKIQSNRKGTGHNFDIRKFLFGEDDQYRMSDWIDINEFSEFGQSLFLSEPEAMAELYAADTPSELNVKNYNTMKKTTELNHTAIEVELVDNWVIKCFQNNHPLIFPYHLNHKSNKIYQLKQQYSSKLDIDFVYFNFLKIKDKKCANQPINKQGEIETSINVLEMRLDSFSTPMKTNINGMEMTVDSFGTPTNTKEKDVDACQNANFSGKTYVTHSPVPNDEDNTPKHEDSNLKNQFSYLFSNLSINKVNKIKVLNPTILDNISYDDDSQYTTQTPIDSISVHSDYTKDGTPQIEHANYLRKADDNSSISPSLSLNPNTPTRASYDQFISSCSAYIP